MRKRFKQQLEIGVLPITSTPIPKKSRDATASLTAALKELFVSEQYHEAVFSILESKLMSGKRATGRPGMDLWQLFVLAQFRLGLNLSYDRLHHMANYDYLLRCLLGVEVASGFERIEFSYQNILDNVSLLDDDTVKEINRVILEMGHDVFKKKRYGSLALQLA